MTYYGLGLTTALVVCEREVAGSQFDFLQDLTIHAGCPASSHPLLPRWVVIGQPCAVLPDDPDDTTRSPSLSL